MTIRENRKSGVRLNRGSQGVLVQHVAEREGNTSADGRPETTRAESDHRLADRFELELGLVTGRLVRFRRWEAELGVVIGKQGRNIALADVPHYVFGYTCVNDITAVELLKTDPSFAQWTRAKSFDGFGPFGPVIATDVKPARMVVRTLVNGKERQNYPVRDMIFSPEQLVSLVSRDLTLSAGDIISCGTSVGAGPIPAGALMDVVIDGVGTLSNRYI